MTSGNIVKMITSENLQDLLQNSGHCLKEDRAHLFLQMISELHA